MAVALATTASYAGEPYFVDATEAMGLVDTYFSWNTYGPGVAAVDFDLDGDIDLFVSNDAGNRLYRNDPEGLTDVAPQLGLDFRAELPPPEDRTHPAALDYSTMMPVFLDLDGDDDRDLFVTGWNTYCRTYENNGDGTWTDRTHESGLDVVARTATAAFADYNGNGRLDVYLASWGETDRLFRNSGELTFSDGSAASGIHDVPNPARPGWCAIWYDFNGDEHLDLYVGNDFGFPNFMYLNLGNGTLLDQHHYCFPDFEPNATMGQALGDYDRDGDYDLYVANSLSNNFYRRDDDVYTDLIAEVDPITRTMKDTRIGWFVDWPDVDNDGWVDLFLVNGYISLCAPDDPGYPFDCTGDQRQKNRLWKNVQAQSMVDVTESAGLLDENWGRSAAVTDFDMDGDLDFFVANNNGNHRYYRNETVGAGHWLTVRLVGTRRNFDAIGARLRARIGDLVLMRDVWASSGYLSQASDQVHFGLGEASQVDELVVIWPNGDEEAWRDVPADQRLFLTQGASATVSSLPARPQVTAVSAQGGARVEWTVDPGVVFDDFRVYRAQAGAWAARLPGEVVAADPGRYAFVDRAAVVGRTYTYWVEAWQDGVAVQGASDAVPIEPSLAVVRNDGRGGSIPRPSFAEIATRPWLSSPVPNPFNPGTRLDYLVPGTEARPVLLAIFDAAGRKVATLLDCHTEAGSGQAHWDGTDDAGRSVNSGVYFARLEVAGYDPLQRKLSLVR